jgi:BirA family biotin operon repressor/biotin-[acetyl-CoA-carboxylase] ligase
VSLAVVEALSHYANNFLVKWPNDVLHDNQKIAGNLIEVQAESNGKCSIIIGIGINVNMLRAADEHISQSWTSLRNITGQYIDRNLFVSHLINTLTDYLERFETQKLSAFLQIWHQCDYLLNKTVTLTQHNSKMSGKAKGINDQGHLLMMREDGVLQAFSSGDTTFS